MKYFLTWPLPKMFAFDGSQSDFRFQTAMRIESLFETCFHKIESVLRCPVAIFKFQKMLQHVVATKKYLVQTDKSGTRVDQIYLLKYSWKISLCD